MRILIVTICLLMTLSGQAQRDKDTTVSLDLSSSGMIPLHITDDTPLHAYQIGRHIYTVNRCGNKRMLVTIPSIASTRYDIANCRISKLLPMQLLQPACLLHTGLDVAYIQSGSLLWALAGKPALCDKALLTSSYSPVSESGLSVFDFDWAMSLMNHFHFQRGLNHYTAGISVDGDGIGYRLGF
jgi:hypothetical protein